MDTSPEYIKMCEKAKEIQRLRPAFSPGLYVHFPNIWVPRQDELQEMAGLPLKNLVYDFMYSADNYGGSLGEVFGEFSEYSRQFTSMEQLWLAFVMKTKFGLVWTGSDWQVEAMVKVGV